MTFMKNSTLHNITRKVLAVLLILTLLSFVGCDNNKNPVGNSSDKNNSSQNISSNNEGTESDENSNTESNVSGTTSNVTKPSANKNNSSAKIDPTDGKITFESIVKIGKNRDDFGEIIPVGNCANLMSNLKGEYDDLAEKRRQEILNTKNTAEIYEITGTTYYISPGGDDSNPGTSPDAPLRTVGAISMLDLEKGDAVLFERDSVFRLISSLSTVEGVIYGAYGEGAKPKIYGSAKNFAEAEWVPSTRKNIWRANYIYDEACSVVFEHGKEVGYRKTSIRALKKNTEFYHDDAEGFIYLYCDKGNPSDVWQSIEIAPRMSMIYIPGHSGDVIIDNLCLKYSGLLAIEGNFNCNDVTVTNCEIGYIGGASTGTVRLGNAVQCWQGAKGFVVTDCWIYQTFDTAISWQGMAEGELPVINDAGILEKKYKAEYTDIIISNNLLEYNNADIEFWDDNERLGGIQQMNGNICRFTSLGWGTRADDGGFRGIEGVFGNSFTCDMYIDDETTIEVHDTIVDSPGREIFSWYIYGTGLNAEAGADMWNKLDIKGTQVFINLDYRQNAAYTLRGCRRTEADPKLTTCGTDKDKLVAAMRRFDLNCLVKIIDKW